MNMSANRYARIAGLLYLVIIVFGIYSEVFIRSVLIDFSDASVTASNILAAEGLYRFGFVADIIMLLSDVAIAILFYILLKPVSKTLSLTAAAFRLMQAAILAFNLLNYYAALLLFKNDSYGNVINPELPGYNDNLALLFLNLHSHGYDLGLIFFAISNFILGYLLIKSHYVPRLLGYGLVAAATVYLAGSSLRFLLPDYLQYFEVAYIVPLVAEVSFCLWLLLKGLNIADK